MSLNTRQKQFCHEYVKDMNGSQSAIRAGYSSKGASVTASKLLVHPNVKPYLADLMEERAREANIDALWVLTEAVKSYKLCLDQDDTRTAKGFLEIVAKHIDVRAFDTTSTVVHQYDGWTEEQLLQRIQSLDDEIRAVH